MFPLFAFNINNITEFMPMTALWNHSYSTSNKTSSATPLKKVVIDQVTIVLIILKAFWLSYGVYNMVTHIYLHFIEAKIVSSM